LLNKKEASSKKVTLCYHGCLKLPLGKDIKTPPFFSEGIFSSPPTTIMEFS